MDLVFDIGNTKAGVGVYAGSHLRAHWRLGSDTRRTADDYAATLLQLMEDGGADPASVRSATIASVVPELATVMRDLCGRFFGVEALVIDGATPLPIRVEIEQPLSVGADRIANAVAAHRAYGRDCIVVDLGTATTYNCVTGAGVLVGGAIAPGVRTAAECLATRTAKLPRVELSPPPAAIGRSTEASLRSGIFFGAVASIDGMLERIKAEWGREDVVVVATGGLAELIAPHCSGIGAVEPLLTLEGLRLVHEHAATLRSGALPA